MNEVDKLKKARDLILEVNDEWENPELYKAAEIIRIEIEYEIGPEDQD